MDLLQECYTAEMNFDLDDCQRTYKVRWFFVQRDDFMAGTPFVSSVWDSDPGLPDNEQGERGSTRAMCKGDLPHNVHLGEEPCGTADQWSGMIFTDMAGPRCISCGLDSFGQLCTNVSSQVILKPVPPKICPLYNNVNPPVLNFAGKNYEMALLSAKDWPPNLTFPGSTTVWNPAIVADQFWYVGVPNWEVIKLDNDASQTVIWFYYYGNDVESPAPNSFGLQAIFSVGVLGDQGVVLYAGPIWPGIAPSPPYIEGYASIVDCSTEIQVGVQIAPSVIPPVPPLDDWPKFLAIVTQSQTPPTE